MNAVPEKFLIDLALGAGAILLKHFRKKHKIVRKKNEGIVTEADKFAEDYVLKKILRRYPNSSIIAEESGESPGEGSLCWVIDPLDGTTNYAHGFPYFCVSIGIQIDGQLGAGVVYNPLSKEMFYAASGKGAFLNGRRISVTREKKLENALLGTGFYYTKGKELKKEITLFERLNNVTQAVRRPGAAALDLAHVACGRYDGFWERGLKPWDVAAGFVLVQEAGGTFTNYQGKQTDIFEKEVIASNGPLHRSLVAQLSKR